MADDLDPYPELMGGISVGTMRTIETTQGIQNAFGTIGAIVRFDGKPMILSCFHVLSPDGSFQPNDEIGQPPPIRAVANLYGQVSFTGSLDVALATVRPNIPVTNKIHSLPTPVGFATKLDIERVIRDKIPVMKRGIRSGVTRGRIIQSGVPVTVNYPLHRHGKVLNLSNQLEIQTDPPGGTFSESLDSGSVLETPDGLIVGMLVGGIGEYSYATPADLLTSFYNGLDLI